MKKHWLQLCITVRAECAHPNAGYKPLLISNNFVTFESTTANARRKWPPLRKTMYILKKITDFIYGTRRVRRQYSTNNPDEKVLAADASKGIMTKGDNEVKRGLDWARSQRAVVLLTDKRIKCGQWNIPLEKIESSELVKINTTFGPGQVLKIRTKDQNNFQFGMQMNREWTDQDVLPMALEKRKLKNSLFSITIRLILIGYILYWIIEKVK